MAPSYFMSVPATLPVPTPVPDFLGDEDHTLLPVHHLIGDLSTLVSQQCKIGNAHNISTHPALDQVRGVAAVQAR